ncbi:alpha/beta hydrolase [Nocardia bovistercoris]|uniref:Alpha/beta fold hydrolase n=1 Tax=Nocardia bovistercoris TaxID=2785916 RepID=A0A931IGI4_9NOCA|nr:alpha/beta hydrolase [Nocardia bovistercoris]MBH0779986.1 alpha/beta fold hydrolase [Nocardia bovistercoris]
MGRERNGCAARVALLGAAVALAMAGCTATRQQDAAPMPAPPAGLERFYSQSVNWGSCEDYGDPTDRFPPVAQCAKITVPVDYARPDGPTAQLALTRIPASGTKIGSLLMNPGGPGVSGLSMAGIAGRTPLSEHFDRVGFDPRGVGSSTPSILCLTPREADAERAEKPEDNTAQGIAAAEADNKEYVDRCAERTGVDFLAHVGTREVVQDMDVMRAVLGDAGLTYLGYSYGTRLGSAYAERFPDRVRALVLDGAVDSSQDPVQESLRQAAGFQGVFGAYSADCATASDCPLGTDPTASVSRFRALVDPLVATPAATSDPRGLSYDDAITGVQQALYSDDMWQALTTGLGELRQGRGDTLLQLADMYDGRREDGSYANTQDAFNAIRCVDDPRITDRAVVGRQDSEYRRAAPFLDDGRGTGAAPLELCAQWPVPNTSEPHSISAHGVPKTVVVSTTDDPATPYQAGVDLARQLGAALITYRGNRHTAALVAGDECLDDAVIAYLVDLVEPARGQTC